MRRAGEERAPRLSGRIMQLTRRSFAGLFAGMTAMEWGLMAETPFLKRLVYDVFGVPLRTGSLVPGSENDGAAFREARLVERLRAAGVLVEDQGDVAIPAFLPHHALPPVKNWPGPRIVWDCVSEQLGSVLKQSSHVPLLIGCDCSIVVGTVQALARAGSSQVHVIYIDGDYDDAAADARVCNSAASLATWLLTTPSPFWAGACLERSQVPYVGCTAAPQSSGVPLVSMPRAEIVRIGPGAAAARVLAGIPASADVLIHLDIDVLAKREMPAAYFPHEEGLSLANCAELLRPLVHDSRVRLIEVSEYASLRDAEGSAARALVDLLGRALA
ncbi:hypothetical protein DYQ86_03975 [Acidobacteria bacterium AB60]|nr:hypothetical protein DYQ86_03975 [Acidobacteria bacterium AB60]